MTTVAPERIAVELFTHRWGGHLHSLRHTASLREPDDLLRHGLGDRERRSALPPRSVAEAMK